MQWQLQQHISLALVYFLRELMLSQAFCDPNQRLSFECTNDIFQFPGAEVWTLTAPTMSVFQ